MSTDHTRSRFTRRTVGVAAATTGLLLTATGLTAVADGTETLGVPSIPVASGTDVDVGGTGLVSGAGTITVDVPTGNVVTQVIAYWEGHHRTEDSGADDTIVLDGTAVTGTLIGGPTLFFGRPSRGHWSSTYRADVTALDLVGPGTNDVEVSGLQFDEVSNGAGLLVISDNGSTPYDITLRDGNDLAFFDFAAPIDTTVPQVVTFSPAPIDRVIELKLFASSVQGTDLPGERPNVIEVVVGGTTTRFPNLLGSFDGDEWDTVEIEIAVPAGIGEVSVQALSADDGASGNLPASLAWLAAAAVVPPYVPPTTTTTTTTVPETTTTTTTIPETTTTTTTTTTVPETTTTTTTTVPDQTTTTTTTTTVPDQTTTTTVTVEPTLEIEALRPVCIADAPFVEYDITVTGIDATSATLEFRDANGRLVQTLDAQPLSGQVIWPGASVDPPDWPGWRLESGSWIPDDSDSILRDGLFITAIVNPEATAEVSYPPPTEDCNGPEVTTTTTIASGGPTTTMSGSGGASPTTVAPQLPATGSDSTRTMVLLGVGLMLSGLTLLLGSRRHENT